MHSASFCSLLQYRFVWFGGSPGKEGGGSTKKTLEALASSCWLDSCLISERENFSDEPLA